MTRADGSAPTTVPCASAACCSWTTTALVSYILWHQLTAGINGCVGLHNQRHFVLFMAWLSLGAWFVVALGWDYFWATLDFNYPVS